MPPVRWLPGVLAAVGYRGTVDLEAEAALLEDPDLAPLAQAIRGLGFTDAFTQKELALYSQLEQQRTAATECPAEDPRERADTVAAAVNAEAERLDREQGLRGKTERRCEVMEREIQELERELAELRSAAEDDRAALRAMRADTELAAEATAAAASEAVDVITSAVAALSTGAPQRTLHVLEAGDGTARLGAAARDFAVAAMSKRATLDDRVRELSADMRQSWEAEVMGRASRAQADAALAGAQAALRCVKRHAESTSGDRALLSPPRRRAATRHSSHAAYHAISRELPGAVASLIRASFEAGSSHRTESAMRELIAVEQKALNRDLENADAALQHLGAWAAADAVTRGAAELSRDRTATVVELVGECRAALRGAAEAASRAASSGGRSTITPATDDATEGDVEQQPAVEVEGHALEELQGLVQQLAEGVGCGGGAETTCADALRGLDAEVEAASSRLLDAMQHAEQSKAAPRPRWLPPPQPFVKDLTSEADAPPPPPPAPEPPTRSRANAVPPSPPMSPPPSSPPPHVPEDPRELQEINALRQFVGEIAAGAALRSQPAAFLTNPDGSKMTADDYHRHNMHLMDSLEGR